MTVSQRRLPAEIYWRRRLLLLAVVIALVWGVLQLTGSDGDDDADRTASTPVAPSATPSRAASATTPEAPAGPTVDGLVDVAVPSGQAPCDPEKVRITPSVRPGQVTRGTIAVGLVVSTTQTTACRLQPDDAEAIAVISANGTPVWDSTVCRSSLLDAPVQLSPQWSTLAIATWSGRGSGSNCASNQAWATAGKYTLEIGTLGGEPGKTSFTLDARPAAVKTTPAPVKTTPPPTASTPQPTTPGADGAAPLPEPE